MSSSKNTQGCSLVVLLVVLPLGTAACGGGTGGAIPGPTAVRTESRPERSTFDFEASLQRLVTGAEGTQRVALAELRQNWSSIRGDVAKLAQRKELPERAAGCYLLYRLADAADAPAVRAYLRDTEVRLRRLAVATVGRLQDGASASILAENAATAKYDECQETLAVLRELAPSTAERVCAQLAKDEDWAKRRVAAQTLGGIAKLENPELLATLVDDSVWLVRKDAIAAVGARGVAAARPQLVAGCRDQDPLIRAAIAEALGKIAEPEDAPVVAGLALSDQDAAVRREAAEALASFGEEAALPVLEKILNFADEVTKVRRAAAASACAFRGERAKRLWKVLSADSDAAIREEAAHALEAAATEPPGAPGAPPAGRSEGPTGR